ncbi:probable cysteine--tRNA ligase, mitochondrial isoform X2 [Pleurodeles waltl]|uniref:probable cysteine--tRNA ligase, mitochondrial isoform X2 n=1 Tax=Pleurodeles waltl TaxID=8319 RepID=UPI003709C2B7
MMVCVVRRGAVRSAAAQQRLSSLYVDSRGTRKAAWVPPAGYPTGIHVYNSLTRTKEPLVLARPGVVTWYSCGPTVYDHAHLGHACSYVRFDIIRRILSKVFEKDLVTVMVITDIDDKIIKRANEVLQPTVYMRVTDNIPQIISFIEKIIKNGHAYATAKGNVYFDIKSIGDKYGKFSGGFLNTEEELGESDKRQNKDFALWKKSKPQEPFWISPWGKGRPGWHIECSTIASIVFGSKLDIHTGGIDLAFPHHENEIAQCEAYHQCEHWGNYFLHTGHLHLKGSEEKMSKSLKNYITIKDFLKTYSADQFRMFCLRCKYRSAVDFSDDSMNEAKSTLSTISSFMNDANAYMKGQLMCHPVREDLLWERFTDTKVNVKAALADDFDTPRAVESVMDLIHHGNRQLKAVTKETESSPSSPVVYGTMVSYIEQFFKTLGISFEARQAVAENRSSAMLHKVIDELVDFRSKVRNYALDAHEDSACDQTAAAAGEKQQREKRRQLLREREPLIQACDIVRQDLSAFGINIKDRGSKTTWELIKTDEKM